MKQRFSSLDVRVICHELSKRLVSLRVANVYDLSTRIFLFKLAKPGSREQLLVDSGFRCHLTEFNRTTAAAPSAFVSRLRKYLKSRRVTAVSQVGTDRIIEIEFSEGQYRVFLEFFAAGNIILTDKDYTVLALLRVVSEGNEDVDAKIGATYSIQGKQNVGGILPLTLERVKEALQKQIAQSKVEAGTTSKKKKKADELRRAISASFSEYPPHLLDHAFKVAAFDATLKPEQIVGDETLLSNLFAAIQVANEVFESLTNSEETKGYIIAKSKEKPRQDSTDEATSKPEANLLYDDYHPFRPAQVEEKPDISILEFDSFNKTVDEFYSSIESQKLESRLTEREENARRKLEFARQEHEKRLGTLQQVQELHIRKAEAIEANAHRVEEAMAAVNGLIGQGMDWQDMAKLIENEQGRQNPVAQMIKLPLKLHENTVTLLLNEESFIEDEDDLVDDETDEEVDSDEEEEEEEERGASPSSQKTQTLAVDIDLGLSPWANARQYYDQRKTAAVKEQRTLESSEKALKSAEKKIHDDLKKGLKQEKQTLRPLRRQMWFEKFLYFISSDGYLVVGGKDAQQNELLYRRYLKKGDVYVHADLPGASSVIVKNMIEAHDAPIPPSTLSQAGSLTVCTSTAWDSKAVMAAWWVNADQVSKTAPNGEYLKTGGFTIKGKKNFLPPAQLLLGFAVMFQISDQSKANHSKHRFQDPAGKAVFADEQAVTQSMGDLALQEDEALEEDNAAVSDNEQNSGSESDHVDSDIEDGPRANPLQANGHAERQVDTSGINDENAAEEDEDSTEADVKDVKDENEEAEQPVESETKDETPQVQDMSAKAQEKGGRRHLSARERRLLRQGKSLDPPGTSSLGDTASTIAEDDAPDSDADEVLRKTSIAPTGTSTPSVARGKKAKNKKALKKYANQDDEDRELAMQILGSAAGQQKKQAAAIEKAAREAKAEADRERRRKQHERVAEAEKAKQERLAAGEADDADEVVDEEVLEQERRDLLSIDSLVGRPAVGDEIVAAIPVCAPWTSLATYKYKVKLQPGSLKKGKAVKEIVGRWIDAGKPDSKRKIVDESATDRERIWPREMELLKSWRVEEIIGIVPVGKVRLMVQGGSNSGNSAGNNKAKGGRGGKGSKKR